MNKVVDGFRASGRFDNLLKRRIGLRHLPWLVLACTAAVSWQLWQTAAHSAWEQRKAEFDLRVDGAANQVGRRMQEYVQVLYGVRGFLNEHPHLRHRAFAAYVASLELQERLPGIQDISYAPLVPAARLGAHVAAMRDDGVSHYAVRPPHAGGQIAPMAYVEPGTAQAGAVFGFDNLSAPARRAVMERARDAGEPILSAQFAPAPGVGGAAPSGGLMFLPVYRKDAPHATLAERRANIAGWLAASFRPRALMAGLFSEDAGDLRIQIFDGSRPVAGSLLFDTSAGMGDQPAAAPRFAASKAIEVAGRTWLVVAHSLPHFERATGNSPASFVALSTMLLGVILAGFTALLARDRGKALRYAEGVSGELRRSQAFHTLLEENERRWKLALEAVGDGVWDWDLTTNRMTYSRYFEEMLGYAPGELERDHDALLWRIHPDDRERTRNELLEYMKGRSAAYSSERRMLTKDGGWRWVLVRGMAMDRGPDGRYARMIGTQTDVSRRRAMEQALTDARQVSDDIINSLPGNFFMFDANGRMVRWNDASEEALGYSGEEMARLTPEDFFEPGDFPPIREAIRDVFEKGAGQAESRLRLKSGVTVPYQFTAHRTTIAGQHYMVGVGLDISARRAAEAAVRENDERYRAIFSSAQDFIFTIDAGSRITSITDYFCTTMGYGMEEVLGEKIDKFFTSESIALVRRMIALKVQKRTKVTRYEADMVTRDGRVIPVEINSALILDNGRLLGSQGIARDITERRHYEEALRDSERRWKLSLEAAGHGVWDWDIGADVITYSALSLGIMGCTEEDSPRSMEAWQRILHPHDRARVAHALTAHLEGRTPAVDVECRIQSAEHEWRWIAARAMVVERGEEDRPLRMLGTHTDIGERKAIETALRLSEAKLQAIIEHAPVGIWLLGTDGKPQFFNRTFCDSLGVSEEACLAADDLDAILGTDAAAAFRRSDREALAGDTPHLSEEVVTFADGKQHHLEIHKVRLKDHRGYTLGVLGISVDVTEQRVREEALRESEERYRGVFDDGNYFVFTLDNENRISNVPPAFAQALGYPVGELDGAHASKVLTPAGLEISLAQLALKRRGDASVTQYETEARRSDGTVMPIEVTTRLFYKDGKVAGIRVAGRDITERHNYERALQESEEKYRGLFESAGDFAYSTDLEGQFVAFSELLLRVTGYGREELVSIEQILAPDQLALARKMTAQKLSGAKQTTRYELEITTRDGRRIPLEIVSTLVYRDGKPVGIQGIGRDMAERKRAEDMLRRSERNYRELMEQAAEAIFVSDHQGTHYVDANQAACDLLGFSRDELIGMPFASIFHPDDTAAEPIKFDEMWSGQIIHTRRRFQRKDGSYIPVELSARMLSDGRLQALVRDISRWLEREAALRDSNLKAEAASRAKSEFLANMSHEIRTPMNSVIGMARLALARETEPRQIGYLEKILMSGEHLLGIIDDILDFSKIEAGKIRIESTPFDLRAVMDNLANLMADKAIAKGLELSVEVDPDLPGKLQGDQLRLRQVLLNFVDNAIKFTSRGGVKIRAQRELDGRPGCTVFFEVVDTGIGMSQVEMAMLFRPFQQSDGSVTRKYGGTGLGLSISKRLVELMGGEAGADSVPGQGSRFWFRLTLNEGGQDGYDMSEHHIARRDVQAAIRNARILLAENNVLNQQVAREFLEIAGCLVEVANNGNEVLDMLQREHFDCVLMDIQMPVLDGMEATRQIRANPAFANIPVIAVTANALEEERLRCMEAGMNDFIAKPLRPEALYAVLAKWLQRQMPPLAVAERRKASAPLETPRTASVIDLSVLAELVGGNPERMRQMADKFMESARDDMEKVKRALEQADLPALKAMGHHIKSPAAMVGASEFARLCQQLEANQDDLERARELVGRMLGMLAAIEREIDTQLP